VREPFIAEPDLTWPPYVADRLALVRAESLLAAKPRDVGLLFERACLLDRLGEAETARQAYLDVLAADLTHAGALAQLGALLAATGYTSAAMTVLHQGITTHPEHAGLRVMLANLLRLTGKTEQAHAEYAAALLAAPGFAQAHQGLSYLLDGVDDAAAEQHRTLGFSGRAVSVSRYRGAVRPIDVLRIVSARGGNIELRDILDDRIFRVHTLVADHAAAGTDLPPHAVTFNAIGDADRCADALVAASGLLTGDHARLLNPPQKILLTGRLAMSARLGALDGVTAAKMACVPHAALQGGLPEGFCFPVLLRSPGYHTGQYFCRAEDAAGLRAGLADLPGAAALVIECLDTRGADGAFRKYRAMFIGGETLPLHLAISAEWKVHYFTSNMAEKPGYRAEEARFLDDMGAVIGTRAMDCLATVRAMLGLDYAGIDFGLGRDGRLVVFEANATMVIARPPDAAMWAYRRAAAEQCLSAAQALIRRQAADLLSAAG
jgi:hypothetical protein